MVINGLFIAMMCGTPSVAADDFTFELDGYYRTRLMSFSGMYEGSNDAGRYVTQRLRLQPHVNFQDKAKFTMMVDGLDDVMWGDNQSLASTALFAGAPSATGIDGTETSALYIKRAWIEFDVPVGMVRIGRQPSHWGMGLLANGGDGFDDQFGENHSGSTYDRALFATRPLAVLQGLTGAQDTGFPLFVGVAFDRLVEAPLTEYYGYECSAGVVESDVNYDPLCDADGDGITDLDHGFTDDTVQSDERHPDWWVDGDDDVIEMVALAIYRGEDIALMGAASDLTTGVYVVNRTQAETGSDVLIWDAYINLLTRGFYLEAEILNIRGESSAIALPGSYDPTGVANPLAKTIDIWGYVARSGYKTDRLAAIVEYGKASGDDNVADEKFTGRALHPDHNVGLLLYEEIMSRVTAHTWTEAADGLWSRGGVTNSSYIFPTLSVKPTPNLELIGGFLMAWPDRPDGSRVLCAPGDEVDCAQYQASDNHLGWEADFGIKSRLHDHILISLEGGYAAVSDRIPLDNVGLNPKGRFYTVQSRVAYEF